MEYLKLCMLAVVGVAAALIVKQWKSDFLPLLRLSLVLFFGVAVLSNATPLLSYIKAIMGENGGPDYITVLFKALGIAILTQCCADICRECGEASAANGVELAGKVELLLLCLPLVSEILSAAQKLLELGGSA